MKIKIIFTLFVLLAGFACTSSAQKQMMKRDKPIGVGEVANNFTLEDENKNKVTLSDSKDKEVVVLVFYRGSW